MGGDDNKQQEQALVVLRAGRALSLLQVLTHLILTPTKGLGTPAVPFYRSENWVPEWLNH